MLLSIFFEDKIDRFGRKSTHDILQLECDVCHKIWEIRGSKKRILSRKRHTCSKECKKNGNSLNGVIFNDKVQTCLKKFGVENPYQSEEIKEKIAATCLERFGVENPYQSEEIKEKIKATNLKRYNVEYPGQSKLFQERSKATMMKNYGVEYPMQIQRVRDAMIVGMYKKYGVKHIMQCKEHVIRWAKKRAHDGTFFQSKSENKFYDFLCTVFASDDVKRQINMNDCWSIDFYIFSIDTYIQFDGVYWHGLDRPIEDIKSSSDAGHIRDRDIYRKWITDKQQIKWFEKNNLKLIRITDKMFNLNPELCITLIKGEI